MNAPLLKFAPLITAGLLASGCGPDEPVMQGPPVERGIVTSTIECAELHKIEIVDCQKAIESAINFHERHTRTYAKLAICEEAEGPDRCERAGQKDFSRRLQAFLVSVTKPPKAAPLYATRTGDAGFMESNGQVIADDDDLIIFSDQAIDVAKSNALLEPAVVKGGGAFGT